MRPTFATAVYILVCSIAFPVPGDLLAVEHEGLLRASEVNELAGELFAADQAPDSRYDVDVYWVEFETTDLDGSAVSVTAQLFIPVATEPELVPLYVFGPGSTGLVRPCRPSREHIAGIRWGLYRTHVLSHVGQGAVGVLPDYVGFNDFGRIQPYFVAESEGRMMLDAVRAARNFFRAYPTWAVPHPAAFLAGYSQGGHAAFAAADLRGSYAPEIELGGVIGYGATTDLEAMFQEFVVAAPLVVYVFSQVYGANVFPPEAILQRQWAETLSDDVTTQCIGGAQSYYPWSPEELYTESFLRSLENQELDQAFPEIARILELNSPGLSGHRLPALLLQGVDDIVVELRSQRRFAERLCESGSAVQLRVYENVRHDTRQIGFYEARAWMRDRLAGIEAPSNCVQ